MKYATSNINENGRSNDSVWQFLAEYSLSEFLSDHGKGDELTTGLLFQPFRELGVPPDWIGNIEMTLTEYAKQALAHFKQGKVELPGRIRVYCQNKIIEYANSARADSRPCHAEQSVGHLQMVYQSTAKMGGWGYFLIERGGNVLVDSPEGSWKTINLYLYKEGE